MLASVQRQAFSTSRPAASSRRPCVAVSAKMSLANLVTGLAKAQEKADFPAVQVGDSVKVGLSVQEGNGKTR